MKTKTAFWIPVLFLLTSLAPAQLNDVQTSFEFADSDGRFILGQCPGCAVFEGGQAEPVPETLRLAGENAWVVAAGSTAVITFPAPADSLEFYFKDENEAVSSIVEIFDEEGQLLETINGSANGPDNNGFTRIQVQNEVIKKVVLRNNASSQSENARLVVENWITSFIQEVQLTTVDTFYLPRFADGLFQAGGSVNQFTTEVIVVNPGPFAAVQLDVFDDVGNPLEVTVERETGNVTTDDGFLAELAEGETRVYKTMGLGDRTVNQGLVSGYWRAEIRRTVSDASSGNHPAVGGTAVFARSQQELGSDVLLFEAGVPAVRPLQNFSLNFDSMEAKDTGLAIVNPALPEGSEENGTAEIVLSVWDSSGTDLIVSVDIALEDGEAVSKFIWEYIQNFGTAEDQALVAELQETVGVVTVRSSRAVAPLTLRQNNAGATFPEAVPTLTTFPAIAGAADSVGDNE